VSTAGTNEGLTPRCEAQEDSRDLVAVRVWVEGRVQGVFYRASTQQTAAALSVSGWVRNLVDGRVEVWAEGQRQTVERLLAWLAHGPPGAHVKAVQRQWETPHGFHGFRIRSA